MFTVVNKKVYFCGQLAEKLKKIYPLVLYTVQNCGSIVVFVGASIRDGEWESGFSQL